MSSRKLLLERFPSGLKETQGLLTFKGQALCTIEQEWRPTDDHLGGTNFNSCVPDGEYTLRPHTRPDGKHVVALENHDLNVYYNQTDVPDSGGRYLILMHIANWAHNVVGCIGPGLSKADSAQGPMVTNSSAAMSSIMNYVNGHEAQIDIRWIK
jgi:hypothetical protein